MMKWVFSFMIFLSVIFAALNGRMGALSNAAIAESANAVSLTITLMGTMCLWSGLMKVAEDSGLTDRISRLLSPITTRLFHGLRPDGPAMRAISMNITANLLGLGNAATPLGIEAMKRMCQTEQANGTATDNMVRFVVLNTASIQLIPTTVATLRLRYGSKDPMEILPAVLLSSFVAVTAGLLTTRLFARGQKHEKGAARQLAEKTGAKAGKTENGGVGAGAA